MATKYSKALPFQADDYEINGRITHITPASSGGLVDVRRRTYGGTIKPDVNTDVPPTGTAIDMVYDYDGTYLGWLPDSGAQKWIYGTSYKTGGRYKPLTDKSVVDPLRTDPKKAGYSAPRARRMVVYDTKTYTVPMVIWNRVLNPTDLIDEFDKVAQYDAAIEGLKHATVADNTRWGGGVSWNLDDPYNIIKPLLNPKTKAVFDEFQKIEQEVRVLQAKFEEEVEKIRAKKSPVIKSAVDSVLAEIQKMRDAEQGLKNTSKELGIDLDI